MEYTFCIGPFPRFNSYEQVAAGGGRRAILDKKKENNTANRDWKGAFRPWDMIHTYCTLMYDTSE